MATTPAHLLALEPELLARLRERLDAAGLPKVHVLSAADLAGVKEEQQLTPAVHVIYRSSRVLESRHDGLAARLNQTWLVVVAVRNVRGLATGEAARDEAGALAGQALLALMGWRALSANGPLKLTDGPAPWFGAGHQYLPLAFDVDVTLRPQPQP